jgi:predicted ester cyclase
MNRDIVEMLVRRFVVEHNGADFRRAHAELLTPGAVFHEYLPGLPPQLDRRGYEQFIVGFRNALPDIRNEVVDVVVDGVRAAARWTGYGTHTGEALMGLPALGAKVRAHGMYLLRIEGDRIAEAWNFWDNLNVLEQLKGG